jgi:hypothetical protein
MIMQEAEAYLGAGRAFAEGQPIGDGLGALVASKLMKDKAQRKYEKDIMVAETTMEDRKIIATNPPPRERRKDLDDRDG